MDFIHSFSKFEQKFFPGKKYSVVKSSNIKILRELNFPDFYLDYLLENGLKEFMDFWWFTDPFEFNIEIGNFVGKTDVYPIVRNAFGCYILKWNAGFYHFNIHTRNFGFLSDEIGLIFNFTLTDDYALRDMFFYELFESAKIRLGKLKPNEIYSFNPALILGGEIKQENLCVVKIKEHIEFLAQI